MLKTVLIPLDGSELGEKALAYAKHLNPQHIRLMRVVEPVFSFGYTLEHDLLPEVMRTEQNRATELLTARQQELQRGEYEVSTVCHIGDPASEILEEAQRCKADLIVIGTHGRNGLQRFLLGSTAERVARHAPCPVLLVRAQQKEGSAK